MWSQHPCELEFIGLVNIDRTPPFELETSGLITIEAFVISNIVRVTDPYGPGREKRFLHVLTTLFALIRKDACNAPRLLVLRHGPIDINEWRLKRADNGAQITATEEFQSRTSVFRRA